MNFQTPLSLILGILLFIPLTGSASDIGPLLETKEKNYSTMIKHYRKLSSFADRNMQKEFCAAITPMQPVLTQMLTDDNDLIFALYTEKDPDSYDYAKHLDENSLSDFFALNIHQQRCRDGSFDPISQWKASLRYSVMNTEYLLMTHQLWMEAH